MHWEKSPPSAQARTRPYQGVRVRDPVKELLRRKRSLEPATTKTAPSAVDVAAHNNQTSYAQGTFGSDVEPSSPAVSNGALQCAGWRALPTATSTVTHWSTSEYTQQDRSAQCLAYSATPTLTTDVYMQTLCPSYTMLTYTHTPLLTNFGTIPVAQASASTLPMELPESALTYLPWAQPLTTISTIPGTGVQFAPGSAALPGSPLSVHMPLSMSLTRMIPQSAEPQPLALELQQRSGQQLVEPQPQEHSLDEEDPGIEPESHSLLDTLLEERQDDVDGDKDLYSSSIFIENV